MKIDRHRENHMDLGEINAGNCERLERARYWRSVEAFMCTAWPRVIIACILALLASMTLGGAA
jgi:hypothetical protein